MPSVTPLPPSDVRQLLENAGYTLVDRDEWNWRFEKRGGDPSVLTIPHTVDYIPLPLANYLAHMVVGAKEYLAAAARSIG